MNSNKTDGGWQEMLINQASDFLARMVQDTLQAALNEQFERKLQAKPYERTEERTGYRNGSYERQFKTRVGTLSLTICRDREGNFQHNLFEKYQRGEKALVLGIAEMYFNGVSTRKVSTIMEELCGFSISKSKVSELVATFDSSIKTWVNRPLEKPYSYLIVDARYEKVRDNDHVESKAFVVVVGITDEGVREVIGTYVINSESYESWDECFKSLKERSLHGVKYIVSDENKGLRKALMKYFQGIKLQRCQVHFMRNFIGKLSKSNQAEGIKLLQDVFAAPTKEEAKKRLEKVSQFLLSKKKPDVAEWLEENIDDTLVVFALPEAHRKKMKSTNMLERLNQELKRRSRVVRIFPNDASCLRLLAAICQEISESWGNRKYLTMDEE
jgi:transposase-like protein